MVTYFTHCSFSIRRRVAVILVDRVALGPAARHLHRVRVRLAHRRAALHGLVIDLRTPDLLADPRAGTLNRLLNRAAVPQNTALVNDRARAVFAGLFPFARADRHALGRLDHLDLRADSAFGLVVDDLPRARDRHLANVLIVHFPANRVRTRNLIALRHRSMGDAPHFFHVVLDHRLAHRVRHRDLIRLHHRPWDRVVVTVTCFSYTGLHTVYGTTT